MKRLAVIPGDPLYKYYQKGEVKERYWNPKEIFDEVHIISLCPEDVEPEKVQAYAGKARLFIHAIGRPNPLTLAFYYSRVRRLIEGAWESTLVGNSEYHVSYRSTTKLTLCVNPNASFC